MERRVGTVARGLRAPIIREGDDLKKIVTDTVLGASASGEFTVMDKDVIGITEAVLARAQGNYATKEQLAKDVRNKLGGEEIGVIFPILSRNRFAICLKGIARGAKKIFLMLSYPSDEVGNHLVDIDLMYEKGVDPYKKVLTQKEFEKLFGKSKHPFTGMDYISYYKQLIQEEGAEAEIIFSNDPKTILLYTKNVLTCDIHTRERTKQILRDAGAKKILGLDDILDKSVDGSGSNSRYGILGSNKATEETIKLFPNDCDKFVDSVRDEIKKATGKNVEVLVYGDGAFKDPVGKIWELADPVVSPGYTEGLSGTPSEIKLKYLADNDFAHLNGEELKKAVSDYIKNKDADLEGKMVSQGTTPRRLTDLIGSLCDLISGSGDKGTPIVYIQGYFDNYTK
ncbi:MAG: F420-0--gamma-glutamyl ligase [Clostridiales bacterium]|jgi:F420-0:gamma-glutamyl ligase|nr:F420-0--gamma-glutamyl ligase [Clostridiales bacterium]